jgi:hypothetical protein
MTFPVIIDASSSDLIELIYCQALFYNGGSILYWKMMDIEVINKLEQFNIQELELIIKLNQTKTVFKYFLSEETMKKV